MKHLLLLFALLLCSCGGGAGEPQSEREQPAERTYRVGVMWQGVQNETMPCTWPAIFEEVSLPILSFLWRSYGDADECLIQFLQDPRPKIAKVFLCNGVCQRNGNCSERECDSESDVLSAAAAVTDFFLEHARNTQLIISPILEDNEEHEESCELAQKVKEECNGCEVWRNPVDPRTVEFGDPCGLDGIELHNHSGWELSRATIATAWSNDGTDLFVPGVPALQPDLRTEDLRNTIEQLRPSLVFIWSSRGNCLPDTAARAPFPYERECADEQAVIQELNSILRDFDK